MFCQWTNRRLNESDNNLVSTARLVFLSKTNKETIENHKQYRCLAVQPTFVRILESIVYDNLNIEAINER